MMKQILREAKRYVRDVAALILLTAASIFLVLARVSPDTIVDETNRARIF